MRIENVVIPSEMIGAPPGYPAEIPLAEVNRKFRELLGPFEKPSVPLNIRVTGEEFFGDVVRQNVVYDVEPGESVCAYHFFRKNIRPDAPGVLAIHPHGGDDCFPQGKEQCSRPDADDQRNYAFLAALRGFRVLAPDALCFGTRMWKFGFSTGLRYEIMVHSRLCSVNRSLIWKSVWDNSRALEALEALGCPAVGVMGHSGGSTQSYILAAANGKVRAAACFASFATLRHQFYQFRVSHCCYHYIPGMMAAGIDWDQVVALIAPRSVMLIHGSEDEGTPEVVVKAFERRINEAAPGSAVVYCDENCGHDFTMKALNAGLDFLAGKLAL